MEVHGLGLSARRFFIFQVLRKVCSNSCASLQLVGRKRVSTIFLQALRGTFLPRLEGLKDRPAVGKAMLWLLPVE
jgi:hypothetical protein